MCLVGTASCSLRIARADVWRLVPRDGAQTDSQRSKVQVFLGSPSPHTAAANRCQLLNHLTLVESAKASRCIYRKTNGTVKRDLMLDLLQQRCRLHEADSGHAERE